MKAKKKRKAKVAPPKSTKWILTICGDCKIRLVVPEDKAHRCDLCKSPNIQKELWR